MRFFLFPIGIVLLICLSVPVLADPGEPLLQEGITHQRRGHLRRSLRLLTRARRQAREPKVLAQIYLYLGINRALMKNRQRAKAAFRQALSYDPLLTIRPDQARPALRDLFMRVHQRMKGTLTVTADQPGAIVRLDGQKQGSAPFKGQLTVGEHHLMMTTDDGLYYYETKVVIYAKQEQTIQGSLTFIGGRLAISSSPSGARVTMDNRMLGVTPLERLPLPAKKYTIRVEHDGYSPAIYSVELKRGVTVALVADLTALTPKETMILPKQVDDPTEPSPGHWPHFTLALGGGAVLAGGLGLGLGLAARSSYHEYETTIDPQKYRELRDDITSQSRAANICFIVAGAMAITALVTYFVWERKPANPGDKAAWSIPAAPPGVSWSF